MSLCDPLPLGYFIEGVSLYDTSHPFYLYPIGVGLITHWFRRWTTAAYVPQVNVPGPHEVVDEPDEAPFIVRQADMSFSAFFSPH